jgi:hypothetical protein
MHPFRIIALSIFAVGFYANCAQAKISVGEARYEAGVLLVRGHSDHPNSDVTLDRMYKERTSGSGAFLFRVRYRPRGCVAEIRVKDESVSARVENCRRRR